MKIFIDSASLDEIKEAYAYGVMDGVTTNPSLLKQAVEGKSLDIQSYLKELLGVAKGTPVSLEVSGVSYDDLVSEGKKLYKMFNGVAKNVYIKIPIHTSTDLAPNTDGLRAIKSLSDENIPVNCTLVFTPEQALLAAKAGAKFISPFAGRIDDALRKKMKVAFEKTDYYPSDGKEKSGTLVEDNGIVSGVDLVAQCKEITKKYDTEILAASLRNARQVRECALAGADIATLPLSVIKDLLTHEKTSEGMTGFLKDVVAEYRDL